MLLRQLPAACSRSAGLRSNWTSFSTSAKVAGETGGPTSGAVPKAGGAPAGGAEAWEAVLRHAAETAARAAETRLRKWRREFCMIYAIVAGRGCAASDLFRWSARNI